MTAAQAQFAPPRNSVEMTEYLARNCTACPLHRTRTNAVPGEGPADARIVLIGEAPGRNEDEQGRPFVGAAGKLLDELLPMAGLSRDDVYITNILKCRPPDNRDPLPEEVSACAQHLDRQLLHLNPELVITLGAFSLNRFFPGETVGKARGRIRNKDGLLIYPVMHPAAALRRKELKERCSADFQSIPQALESLRQSPPEPEPTAPAKPEATQSSLF